MAAALIGADYLPSGGVPFLNRLETVDAKREALEAAYQAFLDREAPETCSAALHGVAAALDAMEGLSAWVKLVRDDTAARVWTGDLVKLYPELLEAYRILRQDALRFGVEVSPHSSRWLQETQTLLCEFEPAAAIDLAPATHAAGLPDGGFTVDALTYSVLFEQRVATFRNAPTPAAGAARIAAAFAQLRSAAAGSRLTDHVAPLQGAVEALAQLAAVGQPGWDKPIRFLYHEVSEATRTYDGLMACRDGLLEQARQVVVHARRAREASMFRPINERLRERYAMLLHLPGLADYLDSDAFHAFCLERRVEDAWATAVQRCARGVRSLYGEERLRTQALRDFLEGVHGDSLPTFVDELVASYESWRTQPERAHVTPSAVHVTPRQGNAGQPVTIELRTTGADLDDDEKILLAILELMPNDPRPEGVWPGMVLEKLERLTRTDGDAGLRLRPLQKAPGAYEIAVHIIDAWQREGPLLRIAEDSRAAARNLPPSRNEPDRSDRALVQRLLLIGNAVLFHLTPAGRNERIKLRKASKGHAGESVAVQHLEVNMGDRFENIHDSVIATRGSAINIEKHRSKEMAEAFRTLAALIEAKDDGVPAETKQEAGELLQQLADEAAKDKPKKAGMKAIGMALITLISSIPLWVTKAGAALELIKKLWES